jgi:hypothetical protein
MLEGDKVKIQREKDQLLVEQTAVKEVVRKALRSVPGLAQEEHEAVEVQVTKLTEAIQAASSKGKWSWSFKKYQALCRKCMIRGRKPLRVQWKGSKSSPQNARS